MAVELAEVAAGLPLAASFALAGGITTFREGRRRTALNEAMHELRRPLQVLSLVLPSDSGGQGAVDSSLRLAAAALERLDREINGDISETGVGPVPVRPLIEEAVKRWSAQAFSVGGRIHLRRLDDEQWVEGDRIELAQVLDNLISNAIDHGGGDVTIEGRGEGSRLLISVCDRGSGARQARHLIRRPGLRSRSRHGHGLRVVARVARTHGGSFRLRRTEAGAEARLQLPLCLPGGGR
jgi:two-component system, OmpR family, sensor histidine kinase MtrB